MVNKNICNIFYGLTSMLNLIYAVMIGFGFMYWMGFIDKPVSFATFGIILSAGAWLFIRVLFGLFIFPAFETEEGKENGLDEFIWGLVFFVILAVICPIATYFIIIENL